jgi:hypothetical protein
MEDEVQNFIASTTINFEGSRFYVRPGDILSYNPQHGGGSLAIFRNGQLVKVLRTDSLVIEAFLKSRFISEVKAPPKPPPAPAGTITLDTLIDGYARTLRPGPPAPDLYGLLSPPQAAGPLSDSDLLADAKVLLPEAAADSFPSDLGVATVDGQPVAGPPGEAPPKGKRRRKPVPVAEIDDAVHPPPPPPSQVPGPEDGPPEPWHNRISEP